MTADQNKKTQRTFQCKDALWQKFEQMARELECSVDYLVNDAMKQYARQRGYGAAAGSPSIPPMTVPPSSSPAPVAASLAGPPVVPPPPAPSKVVPPPPAPGKRTVAPPVPPPPPNNSIAASAAATNAPPPLPSHGSALPSPARRGPPGPPPPPMPAGGRSMPPPPPGRAAPAPTAAGSKLTISYQGEAFPVTKDRFIIGRGKQSSDLTIKDPNVSRQHAMIEFSNGQYYIVDMGSTNGVEYNGQRVQRKVISEGDAFRVCDHELRFTFG
ncbi:MAG TPA: FHA domain-containing protein [Polyangiaceae bacterium]|nr:FHA domain-containing protein [Polyangiaceae bacterium]